MKRLVRSNLCSRLSWCEAWKRTVPYGHTHIGYSGSYARLSSASNSTPGFICQSHAHCHSRALSEGVAVAVQLHVLLDDDLTDHLPIVVSHLPHRDISETEGPTFCLLTHQTFLPNLRYRWLTLHYGPTCQKRDTSPTTSPSPLNLSPQAPPSPPNSRTGPW